MVDLSDRALFLAQKLDLDTNNWIEGSGIIQQVAFTVAGAKGALLAELKQALLDTMAEGGGVADFRQKFDIVADRYSSNWLGNGSRAWRSQLIFSQNLAQAYAAGRYQQQTDPEMLKRRPYWQWRHGGTRDPRPAHLAMDGRVFPADSLPFYPPAGFGCACTIHALSQRDVDREGLVVEDLKEGDDLGGGVILEADPGFRWKPGSLTAQRAKELIKGLPRGIRAQVLREWRSAT